MSGLDNLATSTLWLLILLLFIALLVLPVVTYTTWRGQQQAIQREYKKSMFLAMASHDIRSSMTAVLSSIELLQQRPLAKEDLNILTVAGTASHMLLDLLDDLLDLSKLEAHRLELVPVPCDPHTLIQSAVDIVAAKAASKNLPIHVCVTLAKDNIQIIVDPMRIKQILINLLSNAVKFTETGSVTLSAIVLPHSPVLENHTPQGEMLISVTDTGIGMTSQTQQKLFQPYMQAEATVAHIYGGTGLGLSICQALVDLMQGNISVNSQAGVGTSIHFTIPCTLSYPAASPMLHTESRLSAPRLPTHKTVPNILVVEDMPANRFVIERQLGVLGALPIIAENGMMALDILKHQTVDLILMDCYMPDMDGYETTHQIRQQEQENQQTPIPIIAISAASDATHKNKCIESGMNDVLQKPLQLEPLNNKIEQWYGMWQASNSPSEEGLLATSAKIESPFKKDALDATTRDLVHQSIQTDLDAMFTALHAKDIPTLKNLAHRMKGLQMMLAGQEIHDLATYMEYALENPEAVLWNEIHDLVEAMQEVLAHISPQYQS